MEDCLEKHSHQRHHSRLMSRRSSVSDDYDIYPIDTTRTVFNKLMKLVNTLAEYKEKHDQLHTEKLQVMRILGVSQQNVEVHIVETLSAHLIELQDQITALNDELQELKATDTDKEDKENKENEVPDQLVSPRALDAMRSELTAKALQIKKLTDENTKLKGQVADLKAQLERLQYIQQMKPQSKTPRLSRAPTPFLIGGPPTESNTPLSMDNEGEPDLPLQPLQTGQVVNVNQAGLHFPPIRKKSGFKMAAGRNTLQKPIYVPPSATKTSQSLTTAMMHPTPRNASVMQSTPSATYKPFTKKNQRLLQISAFKSNQFGVESSYSKQQSIELKRNANYYR